MDHLICQELLRSYLVDQTKYASNAPDVPDVPVFASQSQMRPRARLSESYRQNNQDISKSFEDMSGNSYQLIGTIDNVSGQVVLMNHVQIITYSNFGLNKLFDLAKEEAEKCSE